jgi:hypothetical protein
VNSAGTGINPGITSEIWLLKNDSKPPRSNQWNVGVRQSAVGMVFGAAYRGVRGKNLTSWYCAKAHSEHGFCEGSQELGTRYKVLLSTDEGESKYDAFDLTAEKPFTEASRWGFTIAYTMADAKRKGWDFFTFDFLDDPSAWPFVNAPVEKHRITASGIVGLPYQFRLSTYVQWGSGVPFNKVDEINQWGPRRAVTDWYSQDAPNFRQVDLRLHKAFNLPRQGQIGLVAEAINVFDHDNYRTFRTLYRVPTSDGNPTGLIPEFGTPDLGSADPGRRLQVGLDFRF